MGWLRVGRITLKSKPHFTLQETEQLKGGFDRSMFTINEQKLGPKFKNDCPSY